jgi:internalin A
MTFIVRKKHMNLHTKSIAVTCSTLIILALSGNGLSVLAAETQPANKTFGDWCREKASLSPEAQHTIEVLLKQADIDECDAANQILSSLTELDLSSNQISDITPLQSLTNLT